MLDYNDIRDTYYLILNSEDMARYQPQIQPEVYINRA